MKAVNEMKKNKILSLIYQFASPVALIVLGAVLLLFPDSASVLVAKVLGWAMVIAGVVFAVSAITTPGTTAGKVLCAVVCLAVGVFFLANGSLLTGLILTLVIVALLCVALSISIRAASKGRLARSWLVLKEVSNAPESQANDLSYYVGKVGVAKTILRPAGVGEFEGVRLNILTDGEFVGENEKIVVARVEGNRIFVRRPEEK